MVKVTSNPFVFFLLWVIATMIGWSVGIFNLNSEAKTYMDVLRLLPIYLADGLLIGLVVGVAQALVLRKFTDASSAWVWATVLGYGLAFLLGIIVSVLIPSIVWLSHGEYLLPFDKPSTISIWLNRDDIFWGGLFIGAIQWRVLKKIIPDPNLNKAILWVLANWFVLGVTIFVHAFTYKTFLANFQMSIMGMVMGLVTGMILLSFLLNSEATNKFATT